MNGTTWLTTRLGAAFASTAARLLAAALAVQLGLTALLLWQGGRDAGFAPSGPLLAFDMAAVRRVTLSDGEEGTPPLRLVRDGEDWHFDGEPALRADAARAEELLGTLAGLEADLPVASSPASRAQLDVADDDFQRHLVLEGEEGGLAELYVGTSPGFRKAHVRLAGEDPIRAAAINVFDLSSAREDWLDPTLLAVDEPVRIDGEDFSLRRDGERWALADDIEVPMGKQLSSERTDALVTALATLRVIGAVGSEADRESETDAGSDADAQGEASVDGVASSVTLSVIDSGGGEPRTLVFERDAAGSSVGREDLPLRFVLPGSTFDELEAHASLDGLLVDVPDDGAEPAAIGPADEAPGAGSPDAEPQG